MPSGAPPSRPSWIPLEGDVPGRLTAPHWFAPAARPGPTNVSTGLGLGPATAPPAPRLRPGPAAAGPALGARYR